MNDLDGPTDLGVVDAAAALARRDVSASELTAACLARIREVADGDGVQLHTLIVDDDSPDGTGELADELDPQRYAQIHRSVIVNLARVSHVTRGLNETADVHLHGRTDTLPVSRSYLHLFRQM